MTRTRARLLDRLVSFWQQDNHFTILLIALVITVFVLMPMSLTSVRWHIIVDIFTGLLTIAGTLAAWKQDVARPLAATLGVCSVLALAIGHFVLQESVALISTGLFGLYVLLLTLVVLAQVFAPGDVTRHKIEGAVVGYILLGLTAGYGYEFIERLHPGAFHLEQDSMAVTILRPELIYFSYSTLTSVGYGDIVPTLPITRSLASLEAIVGQFYIAILIGGLVSQHLAASAAAERRERRAARAQKRQRRRDKAQVDRDMGESRPTVRRQRHAPTAIPLETDAPR